MACDKRFACIGTALDDLCKGVYHTDLDILECLEKAPVPCKFARPFGCTSVCICPIRKFIGKNSTNGPPKAPPSCGIVPR